MSVNDIDLMRAWREVLTLSDLREGQHVTILTSPDTNPQTLRTAVTTALSMGAKVNKLELPPVNGDKSLSRDQLSYLGVTPLTGNTAALAMLKASDLVLDLMALLFSPEQQEILKSGARILLVLEPPEVLCRITPSAQDRDRVVRASQLLEDAREFHVTSAAGTDFHCPLGQFPALREYGFVDKPGRWDHWPSGFVLTWPNDNQAHGKVVLDKGDILLSMKHYITEPIEMIIEEGYVRSIRGGVHASLLRDYMEQFCDPEAYAVSHIGWGLQPKAFWSTLAHHGRETTVAMDSRAYEGNFLWSLGPNQEVGGPRRTHCHIDIPMRNCSIAIDAKPVVIDGVVQDEEGLARQKRMARYAVKS